MKSTYASIDIAKLIMALLIAVLHVNPLGDTYGEFRFPITRIAVPVFFMLSSYLLFRRIEEVETSKKKQIVLRFCRRNLRLYFAWYVVLFPVTAYIREYYKMDFSLFLQESITQFLFRSTFPASWYIVALVIGVLLVVYLSRYLKNIGILMVGLALYIVCCLVSNYRGLMGSTSILMRFVGRYPGQIYNSFPVAIVWISIGKIAAENSGCVNGIRMFYKVYAIIVSVVVLIVEHIIIKKNNWCYENDCYLSLLLVCPLILSFILSIHFEGNNVTKKFREISTVMYCSHLVFSRVFSLILRKLSVDISSLLGASMHFVTVVVTCILLSLIIDRLKGYRHLAWLRYFL